MSKLIWITGLSGSGKTTIGNKVYERLKVKYINTVFLDGDSFRQILGNDLGHSPQDRLENAKRISRMCEFLVSQEINVVCATMSLYKEVYKLNRENIENYIEVFIECDIDELIRRDQKSLYSKAVKGKIKNVVGVDLPYDRPAFCNLSIDNSKQNKLEDKVGQILDLIEKGERIMKQGDFTQLAKQYINRPAYSEVLLNTILNTMDYDKKKDAFTVVEVGAGTGKLTKMLLEIGLNVIAVEPNDAMRKEGIEFTKEFNNVIWKKGSGEDTSIESNIADWVIMASSFHWTDPKKSLPEFARILKDDGYFTAIWNPRNIKISKFHTKIENNIKLIVPELKRVSSGTQSTKEWEYVLVSTENFKDCIFMETDYQESMTTKRYLGAWNSTNDIQSQAGTKRWQEILDMIKDEIRDLDIINVPYKIRAWTVKKI